MRTWKAAIIGAGQVAQKAHVPGYRSYRQPVEVVALCGRDENKTRELAAMLHVDRYFTDPQKMLSDCAPDVVSVCSPNHLHHAHTLLALEAGCHVLCEKPPALRAQDAADMEEKAKRAERLLAYHLPYRQLEQVALLKKYIDENRFGKVYHIKASFLRRRGIPGWGQFTNREVQGGGALMDIGIHVLDLALYLLDYPDLDAVLASTYDHIGRQGGTGSLGSWEGSRFTVEDACFAHLRMKNGSSITLETTFALHAADEKYFNLRIDGAERGATLFPFTIFSGTGESETPPYAEINIHQQNIHQFLHRCSGQPASVATANEGTRLQTVVEEIYRSAEGR